MLSPPGVISLTRVTNLSPSVYTLTVSATDGGGVSANTRANVSVSLRDASQHPPEFTTSLYRFSIDENASILSLVGVVEASGGQYHLSCLFMINLINMQIRVINILIFFLQMTYSILFSLEILMASFT